MKIDCIVVEDEPLAAGKLVEYIKKCDFLLLKSTFDNGVDAIQYVRSNDVNLIFLDIQMKGLDGIQFMDVMNGKAKIIITSAYSEYALRGYEHNVLDFLLKPFGLDRFLKAVNKVSSELTNPKKEENKFIFVKTEYRIERIDLDEILFIEGMKDYLSIAMQGKKIMTLMSFKDIMELLPKSRFVRVHKSFVVAVEKIKNIERNRIKINERLIPISETYKVEFYALLKNRNYMI